MRQNSMTAAMPRQKIDLTPAQFSLNKYVGWRSKRCVNLVFGDVT